MSDATGDLPLDPVAEDLEWYRVCSVGEIEEEKPFFDTVGGRSLMAVRQGARIAVFDDRCPHLGASMIGATVFDGQVECPLHGACFDASSGSVLDGPTTQDLVCHPMRVSDSAQVEVGLSRPARTP